MNGLKSVFAGVLLGLVPTGGATQKGSLVPRQEKADYSYLYRTDSGKVYARGEISWVIEERKDGSFLVTRRSDTDKYQLSIRIDTLPVSFLPRRLTAKMEFRGGNAEYRIDYSKRPLPVYSTSPHGVIDTAVDAPQHIYDYSQLEFLPRYFGMKPGTGTELTVFQLDIPNGTTRTYPVHSRVRTTESIEINGKRYHCFRVEMTIGQASAIAWYSAAPGHQLVKFSGKNPLRPADTTELTLKE